MTYYTKQDYKRAWEMEDEYKKASGSNFGTYETFLYQARRERECATPLMQSISRKWKSHDKQN